MKKCSKCHSSILDDVKYCYYCGKKVTAKKPQKNNKPAVIIATIFIILSLALFIYAGYKLFDFVRNNTSEETASQLHDSYPQSNADEYIYNEAEKQADIMASPDLSEETPDINNEAVHNEPADSTVYETSPTQFPNLNPGDYLENQDGHGITVNGFDGATYSINVSIVRAIGLDCTATISGDKMYFSSVMPAGGFTGYIQYNGQDYTLIFENSGYPLEAEKEFYGFYKQEETSSLNPSDYIGTWSPGYEGLLLTIESFDGQLMQGTIYTDIGAIPFSGYYNAGLYTSYSYGEYLIDLALFEHFFNGTLSYLGIECSIKNQNYDILFGTTGETKLYK